MCACSNVSAIVHVSYIHPEDLKAKHSATEGFALDCKTFVISCTALHTLTSSVSLSSVLVIVVMSYILNPT